MKERRRQIVVIGGPNGAGKTTISRAVLSETLGIAEFVNADAIAAGLSGFGPELAAFAAGRVMLARLRDLAGPEGPRSFAFESTLASVTFAPWLSGLAREGFAVHILYLWLRSPALAIKRVRARVRAGGHDIPDDVVRRRYRRSAANLFRLYLPLADQSGSWRIYDNSQRALRPIAFGGLGIAPTIRDAGAFARLKEIAHGGPQKENR